MPLDPDDQVTSVFRTHHVQDVMAISVHAFELLGRSPVFAPLLSRQIHATNHHYDPKFRPFEWQNVATTLLVNIRDDSPATVILESPDSEVSVQLFLGCDNEIVKKRVKGKMRSVPLASEVSSAGIGATAARFTDAEFTRAYLDVLGTLFVTMHGEYGWSKHLCVRPESDFDRIHRDPFEPSFVTWANLFGPALVARFGRDRMLSAPAHLVRELSDGSVLLTVAASPLEEMEPEVQETIRRVKEHLGILSPSERASAEEVAAFEARSAARQAEMHRGIEEAFRKAREETAAEMLRQAEGCVAGAQQFWHERLDFSPASLRIVDRLIATEFRPDEDRETVETAVQAFGSYVGEVVRRHVGGQWRDVEMKGRPILVAVGAGQRQVNPFEAVRRRFQDGPKERRSSRLGAMLGGFRESRDDEGSTLNQWYETLRAETGGPR